MLKTAFTSLACAVFSTAALSANIAIIDSGTDMLHQDIAPKAWVNEGEIPRNDRDEDRNGYQDDVNGWNFAESNSQVIDYSYLGTLTFDIRRFFEIQAKAIQGSASEEELQWMRDKIGDTEFVQKLSVYGNFMHGTHVAGIAAQGADSAKIMAVKIIPTEVKLPFPGGDKKLEAQPEDFRIDLIKAGLAALAKQQMQMLEEVAVYVNDHKMDVANGSFGTGYAQAKMIVELAFEPVMRRKPTEEELYDIASHFINTMVREGQNMVSSAQDTLFVFAAGNDGTDNDKYPTSPTNIKAANVISVAATMGLNAIAPFSNYGKGMVDVAAPGVSINSAVPGNQYLQVSGTSQAAPYVANIAGLIKDTNASLGPSEIKKIILETVDFRDYLKDKVKTSGLVNTGRAVRAAQLSLSMPLSQAVSQARVDIQDQSETEKSSALPQAAPFALPLPSLFNLN